jgi:RNA polymerase sigma factor (sigma-70 family)
MSALLQAPSTDGEHEEVVSDHTLVAAVRRGDDRAFETLYQRYHRRIHAYAHGMVKDHGRAEDVTQEVFVSALRRMRATERPIAFKPWIYEIAKNACIDQFRRSRRAEEVSYDAEDGLAPSDYGRLVSREPVPDVALAAKQQLDHLCGAFGGLSEAHHQILVLRELEGLSYREIGERMGLSRPAVESTLFRARRRLTEEYDDLASGQRCLRIQSIIATAGEGRLGARDTRRLARHVAHCQPCRRQAVAAGVDAALVARKPVRERVASKVAALLPFPLLLRGRRGGGGASDGWVGSLPVLSDHAGAGATKLAALAALLVAGLGAGVGTQVGATSRHQGASHGARIVHPSTGTPAVPAPAIVVPAGIVPARDAGNAAARRTAGSGSGSARRAHRGGADAPAARAGTGTRATRGAAGTSAPAAADVQRSIDGQAPTTASGGGTTSGTRSSSGGSTLTLPAVTLPSASAPESAIDVTSTLQSAVDGAGSTTSALTDAAADATAPVKSALEGAGASLPTLP